MERDKSRLDNKGLFIQITEFGFYPNVSGKFPLKI